MVHTNLLRGEMARNRYTIGKLAKEMGVSSKTLSSKLNSCPEKFTQNEIEALIRILKIENPMSIFFA